MFGATSSCYYTVWFTIGFSIGATNKLYGYFALLKYIFVKDIIKYNSATVIDIHYRYLHLTQGVLNPLNLFLSLLDKIATLFHKM